MNDSVQRIRFETAQEITSEVMRRSEQPITACYQCRRCAAGCPVGEATGYVTPDRLIRLVILGDRENALNNPLVWRCVSCYTCGTRCPNNIHTSRLTETLKQMALEERVEPLHPKVAFFHHAFVKSSLFMGRMNELALMAAYETKNLLLELKRKNWSEIRRELGRQIKFGLSLFRLKRLHFGWTASGGRKELKRLAAKSGKRPSGGRS
jgi:heterodisulfide reductase subunit C